MSTDPTPLQESIARALYENAEYYGPAPTQPPWEGRDDEERGEWMEIAAAVLPIIREAQADALREYADDLAAVPDYTPTPYDAGRVDQRRMTVAELLERADDIEKEN